MKYRALVTLLLSLILAGCGVLQPTPQVLPTLVLDDQTSPGTTPLPHSPAISTGNVQASGNIIPARQVQMAAVSAGSVTEVRVNLGDSVQSGQVLVRLAGNERLNAAVQAASLEVLSAEQTLKTLNDNADSARTAAQLRLANANKALDQAQKNRESRSYRNGSQSQIDSARADLILANDAFTQAQNNYNGISAASDEDVNKAAALSALAAARKARDKASANLNYLMAMPNPIEVARAEAELQSAQSEVKEAQKAFDQLKNGPDPDALALAESRVNNARAQLLASQKALADLEMKAPFDGQIARLNIHSGEWVIPGQPVLTLVNLAHLQVETSDLSERDIPKVQVGQKATVFVKALGLDLPGQVAEISPLADTLGGDVVYQTVIDLLEQPEALRPGMSVDVNFESLP